LQLRPKDTGALQMLSEVDRREDQYVKARKEKEELYKQALEAWQSGEMSSALTKLERLVDLDRRVPDTAAPDRGISYQTFYNQVRSEHDLLRNSYQEARAHLVDGNFSAALTICQQYLSKYPGHALFQALKFDVEERQRQDLSSRVAEIDRRVEGEPDLDRRVNILHEAPRSAVAHRCQSALGGADRPPPGNGRLRSRHRVVAQRRRGISRRSGNVRAGGTGPAEPDARSGGRAVFQTRPGVVRRAAVR